MNPQTIVISAVNLRKGGTLTILRQCLSYLSELTLSGSYRIVALVHKRELADYPRIEYIELPWTIEGWSKRLWCEYVTMHQISKEIGSVDLWLSLHDATPRVQARRQAVYCHTSFPFFPIKFRDFLYDPKIPTFGLLTQFTYRINQKQNKYIIVQQEWLRKAFMSKFGLRQEEIIVARADTPETAYPDTKLAPPVGHEGKYVFFYASTPDTHKDFQTLCRATELLGQRISPERFAVVLTTAGNENKYANYLYTQWGQVPGLHFAGLMDKPRLYAHYERANCFVFPSRIETWGLPITEYLEVHQAQRPLIVPRLAYAQETSQGAERVAFFEPCDAEDLARLMQAAIEGNYTEYKSNPKQAHIAAPTARGWRELFDLLLADL
ncbi:MAG: glycosyltransferase [Porphyromonas sp.]|nr:glycosyltransferase [Porphyromonas sp.]